MGDEGKQQDSIGRIATDGQYEDNVYIEDGQVVCPNCGAAHSVDDPRCPYCDALNPVGAEKAYMGELADLKDDTDELAQDAQRGFTSNLRGNAKSIVVVIVAVVAVAAALFLITNALNASEEQREIQSYQARETFRERYYPELDRLYDAGDDAALDDYVWGLADNPGFDALYSWGHYAYLQTYDDWVFLKLAEEELQEGRGGIDDYTWAVSTAIRLARLDENGKHPASSLTKDEEARAAMYRADAEAFLETTLQMGGDEVAAFAGTVLDDRGYVDEDVLKNELKSRLKL